MANVKVHRLELNNFKSYNGKVTVGPFHDFDCVVGPNGAGKSNIMDALSFVLGSPAATLRTNKPEDLINHRNKKGEASVSLVLRLPSGSETVLMRKVNAKGQTSTFVDGGSVSEKDFAATLRKLKIGARTNSYLVFQHEVDALAQKKARELTDLIEEVSGSGELKAEYAAKKKEMEVANEQLAAASVSKRTAVAEVNQMRLQKKEAERFEEVNTRLTEQRRDLALTELFHIECQLNKHKQVQQRYAEEAALIEKSTGFEEISARKKEYAEIHRAYLQALAASRQANIELRDKRMYHDRTVTSIEHLAKRLAKEKEELELAQKSTSSRSKETARLQEQLKVQEAALASFEAQCAKEDAEDAKQGKLTTEQLAEYKRLRKEADCATITLRQEADVLRRKGDALEEGAKQLKLAHENQLANRDDVASQIQRLDARISESNTKLADLEKALQELRAQGAQARAGLEQAQAQQRERETELARVQTQLHELRHTKEDNKHTERMRESLRALRAVQPGVHGRLVDLCTIPNAKYRNAVTVALGKNLEAIVVDTTATAMACVRYLKEQRVPAMTFIPLASVSGKAVDDRLRTLGSHCVPAIDVIKPSEPWLEAALRYALGQTLICDTMTDARRMAYEQGSGERYKVVTLDGSMLLKNGSIQGGQSTVESRARKWDEKLYEKLKERRDQLSAAAASGVDEARLLVEAKDAETRVTFTQSRIAALREDIVGFTNKQKALRTELARHEAALADFKKRLSAMEPQLEENRTLQQKLDGDISACERKVYGEFQRRVGIPNIAEYEERAAIRLRTRAERRQQLSVLIHKLKTSIEDEATRIGTKDPKALEEAVSRTKTELATWQKELQSYQRTVAQAQTNNDSAQTDLAKAKAQLTALEDTIRKLGKESEGDAQRRIAARKNVTMAQAACDALRLQRLSLFQRCRMEDIAVPTTTEPPGDAAGRSGGSARERARQRKRTRGEGEEAAEEETTDASTMKTSEAFTSFAEGEGSRTKAAPVCLDFSSLPDALRRIAQDKTQWAGHKQRVENVIDQLERELESIAPNLKASDRYTSTEAKLGESSTSLEAARERARKALADFTRVKEQRVQRFMNCFDRIVDSVDRVYRDLTMSTRAEGVHGSAYLTVEDPEEPYNGGTKYHATPPMKRFMTIDLLSGGERTMAALALLFAIHQISPAPFFVLDEVDAALDAGNVQKLAQYLHSQRFQCQFVVVSLKEQLYHIADSLIGVYKDTSRESSGVLTLDLRSIPS